jgi:hypothetical protein
MESAKRKQVERLHGCGTELNHFSGSNPDPLSTLATEQWSIHTPTHVQGTSSRSTLALGGTLQTVTTCRVVFSHTSGIASTPSALSSLEHLPTPIPNSDARALITHPLRCRASPRNWWLKQWQLQTQGVSTPWIMVSGYCSIYEFCHSDITCHVFATGILLELYMWNRWPLMSACNMETVSYATWCVAQVLAEASYQQMTVMYWNTSMQQNNIWSIAFVTCTKKMLKEVCWSNSPYWIIHTQTGKWLEHKSIRLSPICFNRHGRPLQSFKISTALNLMQSICNSFIPFWQTIIFFFL